MLNCIRSINEFVELVVMKSCFGWIVYFRAQLKHHERLMNKPVNFDSKIIIIMHFSNWEKSPFASVGCIRLQKIFYYYRNFNIKTLNINSPITKRFTNFLRPYGLYYSINLPTRETNTLATATDNIITNLTHIEVSEINTSITDQYH